MLLQFLAALALTEVAAAPVVGQDSDPNMEACGNKSGAEEIAVCTAWMNSGKLNDANIAAAFEIRGSAYLDEKDYARAIADFSGSLRVKRGQPTVFFMRANAYVLEGNYARAIADYGEVIRLDSSVLTAFNNRAWAYYQLKQFSKAIVDYDTVIRRDPRNVQALYIRGLAEAKLGRNNSSKADIAAATALDPNIAQKIAKAMREGR